MLCDQCDRNRRKNDDGTVSGDIAWAADRARYFLKRKLKRNK